MKEKLLLHICCAPCAIYPLTVLLERFNVTLVFYGPNIYPEEEYIKRLESARQMAKRIDVPLVELDYDTNEWYSLVKGFENEPEGGDRCNICYRMRLDRAAGFAKENSHKYFTTTLTLSPHKSARIINPIGSEIARRHGLIFLSEDFKKNDGFKKSCGMSKEYGLYRQKYCGCEYSIKER